MAASARSPRVTAVLRSEERVIAVRDPLCVLIPVALEVPALVTLGGLVAALAGLIAYETVHFAELRDRMRHQLVGEG
jgi:hypothetical protein